MYILLEASELEYEKTYCIFDTFIEKDGENVSCFDASWGSCDHASWRLHIVAVIYYGR